MALTLHINYRSPSRERLFLGDGWGPRDVSGPYLSAAFAEIIIDNCVLLERAPATLKLILSLSNRSQVDALFVRANGVFGSVQRIIMRNEQTILTIDGILADANKRDTKIVLRPTFGPSSTIAESPHTVDIVRIDELQLIR
jgi:hypothetical protein